MEFEKKNNLLLQRLRQMQLEQCSSHINKQISLWYRHEISRPSVVPELTTDVPMTRPSSPQLAIPQPEEPNLPPPPPEEATTSALVETSETSPSQDKDIIVITSNQIGDSTNTSIPPSLAEVSIDESDTLPPPPLLEAQNINQNTDTATTIGCFLSNIKHLESFDSDATESTSSNDSYDELEGFSLEDIPPKRASSATGKEHPPTSDLKKKAIWKWANERSRLAARWTWLQAQVADLEFRIRGQNEATIHARAGKTYPIPLNMPEQSCARATPLSHDFRRRRLIRAQPILANSNKKFVKYSSLACVCSSLPQTVGACICCNGRYNYIRQYECENMSMAERISFLDPCCHPVLSLPDDVTLGTQLNSLLRQEIINRRPTKGRPGRKKGSTAANLAAAAAAAAAQATASSNNESNSAHGNRKYFRGMVGRPRGSQSQTMIKVMTKYRKHKKLLNRNGWATRNKRERSLSSLNDGSNCSESSNHNQPAQSVGRRRRSEQSAYDIDNIVIPFSIAATTRVEILEYKEIMTPSWRVWENGTCQAGSEVNNEEVEDISDEAYINRHTKGELDEKKRFSTKPPPSMKAEQ